MPLLKVKKYFPDGLYGFVEGADGGDIYFHLSAFDPGAYVGDAPVPPVVNEMVEVSVNEHGTADRVERAKSPEHVRGEVDWFNEHLGYGFIYSGDERFYLHRTEVLDGRLPLKGRAVSFFVAESEPNPMSTDSGATLRRACYVRVEVQNV